jgi:hypothetical protein
MALNSIILSGSARLESAAAGGPSVKKAPPADDVDAVQRIQLALRELGFPLPGSFNGGQPDGKFGNETEKAVIAFQQKAFPGQFSQFDGRVGKNTLAQMDMRLPQDAPTQTASLPPMSVASTSSCQVAQQTAISSQNQHALHSVRNLQLFRPTFIG